MKVDLQIKSADHWHAEGSQTTNVKQALPFYQGKLKGMVHRIRYGHAHWRDGQHSHTSLGMWCGYTGFFQDGRGYLYAKPPEGETLCATCEGRAIGAGLDGAKEINGRKVSFTPRKEYLS